MTEPWDLKPDHERTHDTLPTFIIFCEDEVSEPIYFKYFETTAIKVNTIGKHKSKMPHVLKAIQKCTVDGEIENVNGTYNICNEGTQIWCVYDRDKEDSTESVQLGDIEFNESIKTAHSAGFNIAWSNDAFELWILMHFEDIDHTDENMKARSHYYDKLTEIFKNLENPNERLQKALKYQNFNYKLNLKSEKNFRYIVRESIIPKTRIAIERSKALESKFQNPGNLENEMHPCTKVHYLIEELIRLGGKNIPTEV